MDALVRRALRFAITAHDGQYRKSSNGKGPPYVTHCLDVIGRIVDSGYPHMPHVLAAAALHDVVEDTAATIRDIDVEFGEHIANMVQQLTLPSDINDTRAKNAWQVESMRKASDDDVRIIKIADKVSNVSSLYSDPPNWGRKARVGYAEDAERVVEAALEHTNRFLPEPKWSAMWFLAGQLTMLARLVRGQK